MHIYQLQDNKHSTISETKGLIAMLQDKRSERHTLTINGRTYYYSGDVGLVALVNDFEKLKELGFKEE